MNQLCALSVDLDPLTAYYAIHGLGTPPRQVEGTIMNQALPRFVELFAELDVPVTFFVVAQEIASSPGAQELLRALAAAGHEIANHTYSHPYNLCRLDEQGISDEIARAHDTLGEIVGSDAAPVGFRSPGYFANGKLIRSLIAQGYIYDSSMLPSAPYYFAKAAVMGGLTLRGRRSGAVLADPRGLLAPADPYRPDADAPWKTGDAALMELPIAVVPTLQVPAIGTFLAVSPERIRQKVLGLMARRPLFNLELHGIDLVDAIEDSIPTELAGRQPDLRVPYVEKREILKSCIQQLKQTRQFVTLKDAAAHYAGAGG